MLNKLGMATSWPRKEDIVLMSFTVMKGFSFPYLTDVWAGEFDIVRGDRTGGPGVTDGGGTGVLSTWTRDGDHSIGRLFF